ncbi:MAG TPA: hypothetical protein PLQ32_05655 [Flavihumibacter sp.]|nr:hypothetical protein [Bacteroidota bacterium]HOA37479.1 hypothetical protein [Flavihumibacter sp.]HPZ87565.1 hypothetical protein [Flavihumibacter sp.]HQD09674.1 hypothetical protein [Flavihumibacter sp.]
MPDNEKPLSLLERMKQTALSQKSYGGEAPPPEAASMAAHTCSQCGAGRAKQEGLTHCAYCGHAFMDVSLTDGIHIRKSDNSSTL